MDGGTGGQSVHGVTGFRSTGTFLQGAEFGDLEFEMRQAKVMAVDPNPLISAEGNKRIRAIMIRAAELLKSGAIDMEVMLLLEKIEKEMKAKATGVEPVRNYEINYTVRTSEKAGKVYNTDGEHVATVAANTTFRGNSDSISELLGTTKWLGAKNGAITGVTVGLKPFLMKYVNGILKGGGMLNGDITLLGGSGSELPGLLRTSKSIYVSVTGNALRDAMDPISPGHFESQGLDGSQIYFLKYYSEKSHKARMGGKMGGKDPGKMTESIYLGVEIIPKEQGQGGGKRRSYRKKRSSRRSKRSIRRRSSRRSNSRRRSSRRGKRSIRRRSTSKRKLLSRSIRRRSSSSRSSRRSKKKESKS